MVAKVPLFGAGMQGRSATVTAQLRQNFYADIQAVEDRTRIAFYCTPGTVLATDLGANAARGLLGVDTEQEAYIVDFSDFLRLLPNGAAINVGTLSTHSGRVSMVNGLTQVLVVDGVNGYVYDKLAHTFTQIVDPAFPNGATTCTWADGYFLVELGDAFFASALDDATSWDASVAASAESIPDSISRVQADDRGQVILFGPLNIEFWANTGGQDFPYTRIPGGVVGVGLAAKWSVAPFGASYAFLGRLRSGMVRVFSMDGYSPRAISTADLEVAINGYAVVDDATGLAYSHSGHEFYQLNFPTEGRSWLYDGNSGLWSVLSSNGGRHLAELGTVFQGRALCASYANGKLYWLDPNVYTDEGAPIIGKLRSRHLFDHHYIPIPELWLDIEPGVGLDAGQGSDPQIMLRVSKDGGKTWGAERWASMGKTGEYKTRAIWRRNGRSRSWTFEAAISDPVKRVITGEGWVGG